jgi:hypothetical protein
VAERLLDERVSVKVRACGMQDAVFGQRLDARDVRVSRY